MVLSTADFDDIPKPLSPSAVNLKNPKNKQFTKHLFISDCMQISTIIWFMITSLHLMTVKFFLKIFCWRFVNEVKFILNELTQKPLVIYIKFVYRK